MLSIEGWINGFTAFLIFFSGSLFGLYCIYESKKNKAKLLFYLGLSMLFGGLVYLGLTLDFFTILLFGKNIDNSLGIVGVLGYMWVPIGTIMALLVGAELLIPEKKKILFIIYSILGFIYEIILFFDPLNYFDFVYPSIPGEYLIDDPLVLFSPFFFLFSFFTLSVLVLDGIGSLYKGFKSYGVLRKKYWTFSVGFFLFLAIGMFDQLHITGIAQLFIRSPVIISYYFGI